MGFWARLIIGIGIVYTLAAKPEGYGEAYEARLGREKAAEVLAALTVLSTQHDASRAEIETLAVEAGKALAVLDVKTRRALIDQYFSTTKGNVSLLESFIN